MKYLLLVVLGLAPLAGCGSGGVQGEEYAKVSGTVTFDGKPLADGTIRFAKPGLPPTSMDVLDGKFFGQAMVGKNIVSLSAMRASPKAKLPSGATTQIKGYAAIGKGGGGDLEAKVDIIPDDWGNASKNERTVESGGPNEFTIDITSKTKGK